MTADQPRRSPYQGLTPFTEEDSAYFFGRETETRLIIADLFAAPVSVLYGGSGVGKSSVLRAGVLKALRQRNDFCAALFSQWQSPPLALLKDAVLASVADRLGAESSAYKEIEHWAKSASEPPRLDAFLDEITARTKLRLAIILDQFEEYSVYHRSTEPFAEDFAAAARSDNPRLSMIISLREEAVAGLDRFEAQIPGLFDNFRRIAHLDVKKARDAIIEPLAEYRRRHQDREGPLEIEDELVEDVLREVRAGRVHEGYSGRGSPDASAEAGIEAPYLQLVMTRLWDEEIKNQSTKLQARTLAALGGAEEIVVSHLNSVMDRLSEPQREIAAKVFQLLVTPSGSKIAHSAEDLAEMTGSHLATTTETLKALEEGGDRILRKVAASPDRPDRERYEIFHDRLAAAILGWRVRYAGERSQTESVRQTYGTLQAIADSFLDSLEPRLKGLAVGILPLLLNNQLVSRIELATAAGQAAKQLGITDVDPQVLLDNLLQSLDALIKSEPDKQSFGLPHSVLNPVIANWVRRQSGNTSASEVSVPLEATNTSGLLTSALRWVTSIPLAGLLAGTTRDPTPASVAAPRTPVEPPTPEPPAVESPPYGTIAPLLEAGRAFVVIGNGVSISERSGIWQAGADMVPTHRELTDWIAAKIGFPRDAGADAPSLGEVGSYCVAVAGYDTLDELLREALRPGQPPTRTHRYLANIARRVPLLILTTTWDNLTERAFAEADVAFDLLYNVYTPTKGIEMRQLRAGESEPEEADPLRFIRDSDRPCIYKMFGSWSPKRNGADTFVASEETRMALCAELLGGRLPPRTLRSQLESEHALFLGVGLQGWTERQLFTLLRSPQLRREGGAWAIVRGVSALERSRWKSLAVTVYDEDVSRFTAALPELTKASA